MKYLFKFALVVCVYFGIAIPSKAIDIECPALITETPSVKNSMAEWEVIEESGERTLNQANIYLFHPSQKGAQVPDTTKKTKNEEQVTWRIIRGQNDEFWIGCNYQGTTAILARKLDSKISQCTVRYDLLKTGSRLRLKKISCE